VKIDLAVIEVVTTHGYFKVPVVWLKSIQVKSLVPACFLDTIHSLDEGMISCFTIRDAWYHGDCVLIIRRD
jgi:hypothetical protein